MDDDEPYLLSQDFPFEDADGSPGAPPFVDLSSDGMDIDQAAVGDNASTNTSQNYALTEEPIAPGECEIPGPQAGTPAYSAHSTQSRVHALSEHSATEGAPSGGRTARARVLKKRAKEKTRRQEKRRETSQAARGVYNVQSSAEAAAPEFDGLTAPHSKPGYIGLQDKGWNDPRVPRRTRRRMDQLLAKGYRVIECPER